MSQRWARFWQRIRHFRSDADLEDELRVHLEMQAEDHAEAGMPLTEARRRARLQLGREKTIVEKIRDQEFITMIESWYRDFSLGFRNLRKNPVFCLTAILTLAFGIGANTAIFALLYGLLLRSLPVKDPQQLAHIGIISGASKFNDAESMPYRMLEQLRREQHSFNELSAWLWTEVTMQDSDGTRRVYRGGLVGGNAFPLLGMKPYLGRLISPGDDVRGGPAEGWPVVLSYGFWNDRFGRDPRIIGKVINVSNIPVTVIGIVPPDFRGVWQGDAVKLYLPLQFANALEGKDVVNTPDSLFTCSAIGRLKPAVTIHEARAEIAVYQRELLHRFIPPQYRHRPYFEKASLRVESARTGLPTYFGHVYSEPLSLMQELVAIVLLLCCVNVGGLMMSKVHERQREFAVRTAIGAARWRLIRQYLMESFVIALAGAALGAVAAWYGSPALLHFFRDPMMGEPLSVQPDSMVFWVTALCAVGTTLLFGALPAWKAGRSDPGALLKSRTAAGGRRQIAGRAFVPIQVALSLVLVMLATLLSQSLIRLQTERTGFDLDHVTIQTARFNLLPQKGDAKLDLYQRMVDRMEQMSGIRSAAVTWYTPMTGFQSTARFEALTSGPNPPEDSHMAYNAVGPGYFRTMDTRILDGREFEKNERHFNVCVLNQSAANYLFPRQRAIGRYVRGDDLKDLNVSAPVSCRVIGIAEDAKFASLREPPPRTIYFPVPASALEKIFNLVFLINSSTKAEAIAGYRKALSEIAPSVPIVIFVTLKEQMDAALGSQRLITMLSNFFAGLALFLSALGLYGLLASSVAQRTGEIGIRIALGAQRRNVLRMILSEAFGLLGVGLLLGAAVLFFAIRFVQNMLFGVSAFDPITLAATLALLITVTLLASLPPALRAASVDPVQALRAE
ncbi:MAG: ABC transporter permease [Bryobacteraceae bacterium]